MKYTLVLLLACIPLIVLTVWSVVEAMQEQNRARAATTATKPAQVAELIKTAAPLAREAKEQSDKSTPLVKQLADTNLWDPQPGNTPPATTADFIPVVAAIRQMTQACQLVDAFAPVADRIAKITASPGDTSQQRRKQAEAARQELANFHKTYRGAFIDSPAGGDQVRGAAALFELVNRRVNDLGGQIDGIDLSIRVADALRDARQALAAKKYSECLNMLSTDPLRQATDEATKRELATLRVQAQYGVDRQAFDQRRAVGPSDRNLLTRANDFLALYPKSPIESDSPSHDEIKQFRARLEVDLRTAELKNFRDLEPLLTEAAEIVKLPAASEQNKAAVRGAVGDWLLARGFPRLQPPADLLDKREAWTKKGDRLLGYFDLPPGVEQWRYWKSKQGFDARNPPVGDLQIPRDSFSEDPRTPRYVQWANTYNKDTADLVERPSTKNQWQNFIKWCDAADKELEAYRHQQGVGVTNEPDRSCAGWSFRPQALLAQKLIDRWDLYQRAMAQ
jgi:hypothetical protein